MSGHRLSFLRFVPGSLAVLGTLTLTACPPVEFEGDPSGSGGEPSGGTGGSAGAPSGGEVTTLRFEREPAMGFCVDAFDALDLTLTRGTDGRMSVEGTYAVLECSPDSDGEDCVVPTPLLPFELNEDQQDRLDELVQALPEGQCEVENTCDPCVVPRLELDERDETTHCCGTQRARGFNEAFREIEDFLDSLIPRESFEVFRLRRGPGYGLCVSAGQALDVSFTRDTDGSLSMSGRTVHSQLSDSSDACPEGTEEFVESVCYSELPATELNARQQAELEGLIRALPPGQCEIDRELACDPCVVTTFDIDSRSESGDCCGEQTAAGFNSAFAAISAYVDSLMPRPAVTYDSIRLQRQPGLGFCAEEGEAVDITLERGEGGTFTLSGTYVTQAVTSSVECPPGTDRVVDGAELCVGPVDTRVLSADEAAALDDLVAALPAGQCEVDMGLACDPCVVPLLQLDSRAETSDCCGTQHAEGFQSAFSAVTSYIDDLLSVE